MYTVRYALRPVFNSVLDRIVRLWVDKISTTRGLVKSLHWDSKFPGMSGGPSIGYFVCLTDVVD